VIFADNVWFKYEESKDFVIRGISLKVNEGGVTILLGPNGSGKTTLLKILSLIIEPVKGSVTIDGLNYWELAKSRKAIDLRRKVVYVHEKPILIRGEVWENVAVGLRLRGYSRDEAERIAYETLELLGIRELRNKRRRELSAGEAQMVSIARALAIKPKYLILDEPTSNLDHEKKTTLSKVLRTLTKEEGIGVAIASHDYPFISAFTGEAIVMENGKAIISSNIGDALSKYSALISSG